VFAAKKSRRVPRRLPVKARYGHRVLWCSDRGARLKQGFCMRRYAVSSANILAHDAPFRCRESRTTSPRLWLARLCHRAPGGNRELVPLVSWLRFLETFKSATKRATWQPATWHGAAWPRGLLPSATWLDSIVALAVPDATCQAAT
jgi:hypothetical protein